MKRCMSAFILILWGSLAWAQVAHDPNDGMYRDLDRWAVRGYVHSLPPIRPYPVQMLDELLSQVAEAGDGPAQEKARAYMAAIGAGARPIHVGALGLVRGENQSLSLEGAPTFDGSLRFEDWMTASYALAVYGATRGPGKEIPVPGLYSPYPDFIEDQAEIGPFKILQNWTSTLALGSSSLYFQAGMNRTSFGPFFDSSMVIGAQVGRAGHFSVNYRKDTWSIGVLLLEISASDDFGRNRFPNKHLILHTFDIRPFPNLELGVFESVVWGGRFEFLYMAPFNQYFAAQSLTGFEDNSLVGVHGRWTAAKDLQVLGQVYVDDLHFNDMVRLKLDTKYKFAAELGLRWAPERGPLADLRADYTAIMPYMYSHITDPREGPNSARYIANKPNFYNYSHMGRSLGSDLKPNSDRLSFGSDWRLLPGLELGLSAYLTRHGNASEGVAGINNYIWHDGSYLDDGYSDPPVSQSDTIKPYGPQMTFERMTNFLNQRVIETKAAAGFDLDWSYPTSLGIITAQAGYTLEYGWNRGLSDGNNGIVHFWNVGGGWRW